MGESTPFAYYGSSFDRRTLMRVGFIGLGNMGRAAARNLQRAGFDLAVYDIRAEAGDDLIREGAMRASSPAALVVP